MTEILIAIFLFIVIYLYLLVAGNMLAKWAPDDPERKKLRWALIEVCNILIFLSAGFGPILLFKDLNGLLFLFLLILVFIPNLIIFKKKYGQFKIVESKSSY